MIYFDNAATTFPKPQAVWDAVDEFQRNHAVNSGRGAYSLAKNANDMIDATRVKLAQLVKASSAEDVFFSPSASHAANQIILSLPWDTQKVVYLSPFEHNAIARPIETMRKQHKFSVQLLPIHKGTQALDLDKMSVMFAKHPPDYLFLNHISNVTGAILPLDIIISEGKKYKACVIVDASQSLGHYDYNLSQSALDFLLFTGHKNLYASFGIGGFIKNSPFPLPSLLSGGTGSDSLNLSMAETGWARYEFSSPNTIAIASLNAALDWLQQTTISSISAKKQKLMDKLQCHLAPLPIQCYIPEQWNHSILSFSHQNYSPHELGMILDQDYQIALRTGYHCAPYIHDVLDTKETQGTLRISFSFWNEEEEIERLIQALQEC